jgi:hydroxymethylpyrimidine pyrophosphatase-like HAD family hydrolase
MASHLTRPKRTATQWAFRPTIEQDQVVDVELVVTDLDGTFWDGDDAVHPDALAAVAELEARGIPLLVATGRRLTSTRDPLAKVGLTPPAVMLNGALCLDLVTSDRFHRHAFDLTDAADVLEGWLAVGVEPVVYVDHPEFEVFVGDRPATHPTHLDSLGALASVDDLRRVVKTFPVLAIAVIGCELSELDGIASGTDALAAGMLVPAHGHYPGRNLHHWPRGLSKWDGVMAYCALAEIDPGRVLSVGDSLNDLELLGSAAVSCAPSNAHPGALNVATHVIRSPEEGGWADILEYV